MYLPQAVAEIRAGRDAQAKYAKSDAPEPSRLLVGSGRAPPLPVAAGGEALISREVELKLVAETAQLDELARAIMARGPAQAAVPQRLVSTYFDTPDRGLRRAGLVLRVRERSGQFVQTVKSDGVDGAASPLARGEWEDAVAGNAPDVHAGESGARIPPQLAAELRPLFVTEIERLAVEIAPVAGTCIEAAIDRGVIRTPDQRSEPVAEIELELKQGEPASLCDLALDLLAAAPFRLELRSKAERGYQLALGPRPDEVPAAEPVVLSPEMTIDAVLQRIGRACLVHFLRAAPLALDGDAEGIHQMRVALRRLRSILSVVKANLPEAERRRAVTAIKQLNAPLGPARNLDVFVTELLPPMREQTPDEPDWSDLGAAAQGARAAAHRRVAEAIRSPEYTACVLRLLRWFEACEWRRAAPPPAPELDVAIGALAAAVLDRRRQSVRKRSRHFRRLSAPARHRLRIAVKKLRYAVELLDSLYDPGRSRPYVARLKRAQDALGYANDVHVAYRLVIELGRSAAFGVAIANAGAQLLAAHQSRLVAGEDRLRRRLRRLNKARPFWRG